MKISPIKLLFIGIVQLAAVEICNAQTAKIETLQSPPAKIKIDGNTKEWGDSLHYYNAEKKINYALANTKDTLYVAIRVSDRNEQTRILKAGFTFSVDTKGKKKETFSLTYPLNLQGIQQQPAPLKDDNDASAQQDREDLAREKSINLRGIRVEGFKDIEGDIITTSNTYGIQAAINYDDNDYLVCELAVPLAFFHAGDPVKNEWAFDFKINGITRPSSPKKDGEEGGGGRGGRGGGGGFGGGGGGRGGRGGRGGSGNNNTSNGDNSHETLAKSEDFWEKFYLAK